MLVIPSIDLRGGWVVKLTGGNRSKEWRISDDPVAVARRWAKEGARWIHVVDLDAAFGEGDNRSTIRAIVQAVSGPRYQLSGGARTIQRVAAWLKLGADRVIVGTRAVQDRAWLKQASARFGKALWVAVDSLEDRVVVRGWTEQSGLILGQFVTEVDPLRFGGYLYTDVRKEGRQKGFDETAVARMVSLTRKPVIYSGGVSDLEDVRRLRRLGVDGAISGAALYRGVFTLKQAKEAAR